jgi:hypothetical protein
LLNPDFRDMLSVLCEEGAEFLLVGAYALATHGLARATGDMDIWIRRSQENVARVWRALRRFGAPLTGLSKDDLNTPNLVFQIGIAPRRIDILTSIDAVRFDEAWPDRRVVEIEGLSIGVIGRSHFIQNKRAVGRPQDLADVAWLEGDQT